MTRRSAPFCATLAFCLLCTGAVRADLFTDAEDLFAEKAFAEATQLYAEAARQGSAPAMMRLGLMADSGLGQARDPVRALDWYRKAASRGLADGMFNVAVMNDAGIGTDRSEEEAFIWYSRAALRGHRRAQYNLGLLFDSGIGVERNTALSRYWYTRAAETLPAAAEKIDSLTSAPPQDDGSAPRLMPVTTAGDGIEVIWQAGGLPENRFVVEIARNGPDGVSRIETFGETGSAKLLPLSLAEDAAGIRVTQIAASGESYRSSDWQSLQSDWTPPVARVTLRGRSSVNDITALADILAQDLAPQNIALEQSAAQVSQTQVRYGFAQDADLAAAIASLLPMPADIPVTLDTGGGLLPGRIALDIRTDPPGPGAGSDTTSE